MHSLFCQLPNYNLFTQHVIYLYGETPLVNYGPRSIVLYLYYHLLQALFTFRKHYFILPQANIFFHTICLILYLQQTGEIDNLTVSWGKVVWLCYVQVPRCCWRRHHAQDFLWRRCQSQLATTFRSGFFSYWSIKPWFHTEGKLTDVLIIPSSWGFPIGPVRHQDFFLRRCQGERGFLQGESLTSNLFYFVIVLLSFFILFCLLLVYQKYKKRLVPFIVVIFIYLFYSCYNEYS
jgi:hypothetical protein